MSSLSSLFSTPPAVLLPAQTDGAAPMKDIGASVQAASDCAGMNSTAISQTSEVPEKLTGNKLESPSTAACLGSLGNDLFASPPTLASSVTNFRQKLSPTQIAISCNSAMSHAFEVSAKMNCINTAAQPAVPGSLALLFASPPPLIGAVTADERNLDKSCQELLAAGSGMDNGSSSAASQADKVAATPSSVQTEPQSSASALPLASLFATPPPLMSRTVINKTSGTLKREINLSREFINSKLNVTHETTDSSSSPSKRNLTSERIQRTEVLCQPLTHLFAIPPTLISAPASNTNGVSTKKVKLTPPESAAAVSAKLNDQSDTQPDDETVNFKTKKNRKKRKQKKRRQIAMKAAQQASGDQNAAASSAAAGSDKSHSSCGTAQQGSDITEGTNHAENGRKSSMSPAGRTGENGPNCGVKQERRKKMKSCHDQKGSTMRALSPIRQHPEADTDLGSSAAASPVKPVSLKRSPPVSFHKTTPTKVKKKKFYYDYDRQKAEPSHQHSAASAWAELCTSGPISSHAQRSRMSYEELVPAMPVTSTENKRMDAPQRPRFTARLPPPVVYNPNGPRFPNGPPPGIRFPSASLGFQRPPPPPPRLNMSLGFLDPTVAATEKQAMFEKVKPVVPGAPKLYKPLSATQKKKIEKNRLYREKQQKRAELEAQRRLGNAQTPVKKLQCKFFKLGKCSKTDCPFSHDFVPDKIPELCKFYLMDFCAKGSACVYYHGDWPCKFHHSFKKCMHGSNCKFSHLPLTDVTRQLLEKSCLFAQSLADSEDSSKLNDNAAFGDPSAVRPQNTSEGASQSCPEFSHTNSLHTQQRPPSQPTSGHHTLPTQLPTSASTHTPALGQPGFGSCISLKTTPQMIDYTLNPIDAEVSWRPALPQSLRPGDARLIGDPRVHFYIGGTGLGAVRGAAGAAVVLHPGAASGEQHEAPAAETETHPLLRPYMVVCSWNAEGDADRCLTKEHESLEASVCDKAQLVMGFYSETDRK